MDLFEKLPWRISEPSVLDVGTNFLKEETVSQSYVFLDNFIPPESEEKPKPKKPGNKNVNKILKGCYQISRLNETEHEKCLQALLLLETGRPLSSFSLKEQQIIKIYNNLRSLIHEENLEFLKFAEEKWKKNVSGNTRFFSQLLHSFALAKRVRKLANVKKYPEFYAGQNMIPLTKTPNEIETIHEACLLELGFIATLQLPDIQKNAALNANKLPPLKQADLEDYLATTKLSVSEDIHAEFLANQTACNIVLSSSGLKTIIDNFGPDFTASWDIPITVKEHEINGHKFNVVYVDKSLPKRNISMVDLNYYVRKILLKRTLCQMYDVNCFTPPPLVIENFNAKKYVTFNSIAEEAETLINKNINVVKNTLSNSTETKDDTKTSECTSPKRKTPEIERETQTNDNTKTNECSTPKKQKLTSEIESPLKTNANTKPNEFESPKKRNKQIESPLKSPSTILTRSAARKLNQASTSELSETESPNKKNTQQLGEEEPKPVTNNEKSPNSSTKKKGKKKKYNSNHNVNYRLWKLKSKDEENVLMKNCAEKKEIKIIVRSKIDAFQDGPNEQKIPANICAKLEFLPEHGGQVYTKSELFKQWTTLFFRPFTNLIRVRLNSKNNQYLKFENVNLNKVTNECIKHNFNPKDSVGVLFNVLSNLTNLEPGKYLLHHTSKQGPFAALLKSVPESSPSELNLHDLYKNDNCSITNTEKWIPIDTTLILPKHVNNRLMPGMFPPHKSGNNKNKGKFKQNRHNFAKNTKQRKQLKDWDAPTE